MSVKVEAITCESLHVAKGPYWDSKTNSLFCVDIFKGTVHSYNASNNKFNTATVGKGDQPLSIIVPVECQKNKFLISVKNDLALIDWDGVCPKIAEPEVIACVEPKENTNRINNGKVDPRGRLWAGTTGRQLSDTELIFEEGVAALYCLHKDLHVTKQWENISISNGLEWSSDKTKFFYCDSNKYRLDCYDYNDETSQISNERTIFCLKKNCVPGLFDAMAIDTCGKLYIANYLGNQVVVIDSNTGKLVDTIQIPAKQVTSCTFGGPSMDVLYVTTGSSVTSPSYPDAGKIFRVTNLGVHGVPNRPATI